MQNDILQLSLERVRGRPMKGRPFLRESYTIRASAGFRSGYFMVRYRRFRMNLCNPELETLDLGAFLPITSN